MEVEHFNPQWKKNSIQRYANLLLASRHCNGAKSSIWPSKDKREAGVYFIDPTKELDYGLHIFEDPDTHEVFGVTPAGKWQVLQCDLNASHLIKKRAKRAVWLKIKSGGSGVIFECKPGQETEAQASIREFDDHQLTMIPQIPYKQPPKARKGRRRKLVIA